VGEGIQTSGLIYITPYKSNGEYSSCQSEIWFVERGGALYVCTDTGSWRARAPRSGLDLAHVWVGDVGVWRRGDNRHRALPSVDATASVVTDDAMIEDLLERFGSKYRLGWLLWRGRFRRGLEDGSRVMLRYQPVT